jgi:cation diffusion facilitator family transporter
VVNGVCVALLNVPHEHGEGDAGAERHTHRDLNLRAAYLHVLADALTSLLAIVALLGAKYLGLTWMDPLMGIVGAILVARWSLGLMRDSGRTLLDRQAPEELLRRVARAVEDDDTRVADLHIWSIGPGVHAAELVVVTPAPLAPDAYKERLPVGLGLGHVAVEVHRDT